MGECALCGEQAQLRRSHLIPELLHRPLYDEKNRMLMFEHAATSALLLQKGFRESLLCDSCEQRMHVYEDFFDKRWRRALPDPIPQQPFALQIEYRRTKLFILSILWRVSVSKLEVYDKYSLGPHEERIRQMLLNDDPGTRFQYPVIGGAILKPDDGHMLDSLMLAPIKLKVEGHWATRMIAAGVAWTVFTTSHSLPEYFDSMVFNEAGVLPLYSTTADKVVDRIGLRDAVANLRLPPPR